MRRASWPEVIAMWAGIVLAVFIYLALVVIVVGGAYLVLNALLKAVLT